MRSLVRLCTFNFDILYVGLYDENLNQLIDIISCGK